MPQSLNRFRMVTLSPELQSQFGLRKVICADPTGLSFPIGQNFYYWLVDENYILPDTAESYLRAVLQFFDFLWSCLPRVEFDSPINEIRQTIRTYLRDRMGCGSRSKGEYIKVLSPQQVRATTVQTHLVALRQFYDYAIDKNLYGPSNPLVGVKSKEQHHKPSMPVISGVTAPDWRKGRQSDLYFRISMGERRPEIIDDPDLPQKLLPHFKIQRDLIIVRILFEIGVRIGEVLKLKIGDLTDRHFYRSAKLPNKGSNGMPVKERRWSPETVRLLRQYIQRERFNAGPDKPLFVTSNGDLYDYDAFYHNWQVACGNAHIELTPHGIRHWFVTLAKHFIHQIPEPERLGKTDGLITHMFWRDPATIEIYDHHINFEDFSEIQQCMFDLVEDGIQALTAFRKQKMIPSKQDAIPSTVRKPFLNNYDSSRLSKLLNEIMDDPE